ncbi:MAG: hypothetical protein KBT89_16990, partial [Gammaproteobacteria bacterium]|nr:hypothetical protein [Gammaproteobacteria bacterium]
SDVLSTPTILTLDNEEAEIVIGQEVPFVTGTFNSGINSAVNQGDNQNSSLGTGFQTIERKDVGIKLKIKPQINDGDTIQLEVLQETSSLVTQAVAGSSDLITNRRSIEAVVQVDDGQVVVLGGLITENVVDTVNKVPFLGDIPILGVLFRSKEKKVEKRNLMVFLKPRIIRSPKELASFSKVKYDEVRRDGQVARLNSSDLLIPEAEPPVLVKYETTLNDGQITTESRRQDFQSGEVRKPLKSRIKDIIFGRNKNKPVDPPYSGNQVEFDRQTRQADQIKLEEMVDELESESSNVDQNGMD